MSPARRSALAAVVGGMTRCDPDGDYFGLTLLGTPEGKIRWAAHSEWAGFSDRRRGWELRKPRIVAPQAMAALWRAVGEPFVFVNDERQLAVYLRVGGNGIVFAEIANKYLAQLIRPIEVAPEGLAGFRAVDSLELAETKRAPSRRVRMGVLLRDGRRCRVCGASPDDDVHVRLDVHHRRPWGMGGLTNEDNVLTLCNTCHEGLYPHWLFAYTRLADIDPFAGGRKSLHDGVQLYRAIAERVWGRAVEAGVGATNTRR